MGLRFVKTNIGEFAHDLRTLPEKLQEVAVTRSLNTAVRGLRTEARRTVQAELTLKAKDINRALSIRRAHRRFREAALEIASQPVPLSRYGARQTARGVTVKVKRKGGRKTVESAFLAKLRSGHLGVFVRHRLGSGKRAGRLPIDELFSTSVIQFLDDATIVRKLKESGGKRFEAEFGRQIRLAFAKQVSGALGRVFG